MLSNSEVKLQLNLTCLSSDSIWMGSDVGTRMVWCVRYAFGFSSEAEFCFLPLLCRFT